ncbi:MAG TPA: hypothetical protein PKK06_09880 [Phycisphaerae bacterium]|nr:hypothetical protein [Phycisphaerae bacterium]HNU45665.1 hypothetical protein [Phycisphaerae bacterium]
MPGTSYRQIPPAGRAAAGTIRRASGIVRTLVVASATLAVLLVCFAIYQYSQLGPESGVSSRTPPPVAPGVPSVPAAVSGSTVQVKVGPADAQIGQGQRLTLTISPREGNQSAGEVAVKDWKPVEGSPDEIELDEPEFRLRLRGGQMVRATAVRGLLEVRKRSGGGLDPQRGRLTGQVVIEIDRRSAVEREEQDSTSGSRGEDATAGDGVPPAALIRVELDEIEFDLEYARVVIPGEFHLEAVDAALAARGLEVRFNEPEGRVEYVRMEPGGARLELRADAAGGSLALPGLASGAEERVTLVERLRATIERRLTAPAQTETRTPSAPEKKIPPGKVFVTDAGEVIGGAEEKAPARARPAVKYYGRFEDRVDVAQLRGEETVSRLQADLLEIVRDFTEADRAATREELDRTAATSNGAESAAAVSPGAGRERMVLAWSGRLAVEALRSDDPRAAEVERARVIATGKPARMSTREGEAVCARLTYDPDAGNVWFEGDAAEPALVRSAGQGQLAGEQIYVQRADERLYVQVTGPGRAERAGQLADDLTQEPGMKQSDTEVHFDGTLELHGRVVMMQAMDFTGTVTRREQRVLEQAVFTDGVRMRQGDGGLSARQLQLTFAPPNGRDGQRQRLERAEGAGGVVLTQGEDQVSCEAIDALLTVDPEGRPIPLVVTAMGEVAATQGERLIRARDKIIAQFETVSRPAPPYDFMTDYVAAQQAGLDVTKIDWQQRRARQEKSEVRAVEVQRLQGFGAVRVVDPAEGLEVDAEQLDCTLTAGRQIDAATVAGTEQRPATVQLGSFSVSGKVVEVRVPDQWAQVPGPGHLTFRSSKDLDGRKVEKPIPISVSWAQEMKFRGRENWADFLGGVHAASENEAEFDCERLRVEFDDVPPAEPAAAESEAGKDWWIFQDLADRVSGEPSGPQPWERRGLAKEPAHIRAEGGVKAKGTDIDPETGAVRSRALIRGPKLSVNLRQEVSKLLIEGHGYLTMEDFRSAEGGAGLAGEGAAAEGARSDPGFSLDAVSGPSKTLIEWGGSMWYDFSIHQARFDGGVQFKHFSGSGLQRLGGTPPAGVERGGPGRATFLDCDTLTADFQGGEQETAAGDTRFGRLSGARLRQFRAAGAVRLIDEMVGFWLTAQTLSFERERNLLSLEGLTRQPAEIVLQRLGELPQPYKGVHIYYNIRTGRVDVHKPSFQGATP